MRLLAVDTAQAACSAALVAEDGTVLAARWEAMRRGHAERLAPMVREVLDDAGCRPDDLDALGVTLGPGTFAGVRAGIAFIRGMAVALDLPALGVTSLEAVAAAVEDAKGAPVITAFDARREEVYWQLFDGAGRAATEPALSSIGDVIAHAKTLERAPVLVGTGASLIAEGLSAAALSAAAPLPDARVVARLVLSRGKKTGWSRAEAPKPLYLRQPDAKLPGGRPAAQASEAVP